MQHNASVSEFCTAPERQWDMTTNSFTADVRNLLREMNVEDGSDLEKVKLDSLVVIDRLERMVESRPKTLKALRTVITPVAKKGDKIVQYRFASAEMKGESVKKLQE